MRSTIQNQIVLETAKLEKLEKQAHQWDNQEIPSVNKLDTICPHMKILMDTADEKPPIFGARHEEYYRSLNSGENVNPIQNYNLDHRHLENSPQLDRISTPTGHYSRSHCGSMCPETTDHPTTQSMKTNHRRSNHLKQCSVEYLPYFFRTKKYFVPRGDVGGASR